MRLKFILKKIINIYVKLKRFILVYLFIKIQKKRNDNLSTGKDSLVRGNSYKKILYVVNS